MVLIGTTIQTSIRHMWDMRTYQAFANLHLHQWQEDCTYVDNRRNSCRMYLWNITQYMKIQKISRAVSTMCTWSCVHSVCTVPWQSGPMLSRACLRAASTTPQQSVTTQHHQHCYSAQTEMWEVLAQSKPARTCTWVLVLSLRTRKYMLKMVNACWCTDEKFNRAWYICITSLQTWLVWCIGCKIFDASHGNPSFRFSGSQTVCCRCYNITQALRQLTDVMIVTRKCNDGGFC